MHVQKATVLSLQNDSIELQLPDKSVVKWPWDAENAHMPVHVGDELTLTLTREQDLINELLHVHEDENTQN